MKVIMLSMHLALLLAMSNNIHNNSALINGVANRSRNLLSIRLHLYNYYVLKLFNGRDHAEVYYHNLHNTLPVHSKKWRGITMKFVRGSFHPVPAQIKEQRNHVNVYK
jgi:hypothetical protein